MGPISKKEIKLVTHQMRGLKAPGPDGFQGLFYHSFWDTLVLEVNAIVWDIVHGVASPQRFNSTYIVLVRKVKSQESVG